MVDKSIVQKGITTREGNVVAGDLTINEAVKIPDTPLKVMAERYQGEIVGDGPQKAFIDELSNYMQRVSGKNIRNLEEKLQAANRLELVNSAMELKEHFTKKLYKHQFSPLAQTIFVHALAKVRTIFEQKIKSMLNSGISPSDIDAAIYSEIIEELYAELGLSKISITMDHIRGMLYYLTGNCYIDWD